MMPRLRPILDGLEAGPVRMRSPAAWCGVAARVMGLSGGGVSLMPGTSTGGSLCATDAVSARIEELQLTFGEGPAIEAYRQGRVIGEADLAATSLQRWPAFRQGALEAGALAVFSFPVGLGTARLGSLDFYRDTAGPLDKEQRTAGLILGEALFVWVLDIQAGAPPGTLADPLVQDSDFHAVVHKAAGAVSAQAGVDIADALILLRAHAFRANRSLTEVAEAVLARKILFTRPTPP